MASEIWDLYDAQGRKTGQTMRRSEAIPAGLYHRCVHIWPMNSRGEFLIQQRAESVQWKPGLWSVTGGCAVSGEDIWAAAHRELREELGYQAAEGEVRHIATLRRANAFCGVFALFTDMPPEAFLLQKEEVSAVAWCGISQLEQMLVDGRLHHYGHAYFKLLFDYRRGHI